MMCPGKPDSLSSILTKNPSRTFQNRAQSQGHRATPIILSIFRTLPAPPVVPAVCPTPPHHLPLISTPSDRRTQTDAIYTPDAEGKAFCDFLERNHPEKINP